MRLRPSLLIVLAALLAGLLGLAASVAVYGPGPLLASPLGRLFERVLPSSGPGMLAVGEHAPPWTLATLDGGRLGLPMANRAVLINYWASWCGPCREELPLLVAGAPSAGLVLVPIALDNPDEARAFLSAHPLPGPVPVESPGPADSSLRLGNRAGVLPFSVLIDSQGRLRARKTGAFKSPAELQAWIEQGLAAP